MENKVLVAMSGGVDSAAAALILKSKYDVIGGTMLLCGLAETDDAAMSAKQIGIPHHYFDMHDDFKSIVMDAFAESYLAGETPNPCVLCNYEIKFGLLMKKADALDCDYIATGHYVRKEYDPSSGRYYIKKGADNKKDQSYVLYRLDQNMLKRSIFPLGTMTKPEIRALAAEAGIQVAAKKDSQDICFIPDGDYFSFLKREYNVQDAPGDFVLGDGTALGRHKGLCGYTLGQRKGLGISYEKPLYVISKDRSSNTVTLGDNNDLFKKGINIKNTNWQPFERLYTAISAEGKIRYTQATALCKIHPTGKDTAYVEFDQPQRAPTPGQSAVFYDGDVLLGGGIIC